MAMKTPLPPRLVSSNVRVWASVFIELGRWEGRLFLKGGLRLEGRHDAVRRQGDTSGLTQGRLPNSLS